MLIFQVSGDQFSLQSNTYIYFLQVLIKYNSLITSCSSPFHLTVMAQTYEYPATLDTWRPIQYDRNGSYPSTLRFRHHFFLCRLKIVIEAVYSKPPALYLFLGLRQEVVGIYFHFLNLLTVSIKAPPSHQPRPLCRSRLPCTVSVFSSGVIDRRL